MNIQKMNLSELRFPEKNVRIHTERQLEEFVRSIQMFGQIRPVVVDDTNTILAGNGLVLAIKKAGIEQVDVYKIDGLTENQKKKLMIADNKIFSLGIENLDTLNSFLDDLRTDLDIPGFDEEILKSMVAEAEDVTTKIAEYGTLDEEEIEHIKANKEKKEALIIKQEEAASTPQEPQQPQTPQQPPVQMVNQEPTQTVHMEPVGQEEGNFIVCPHCGEKIWQ